LGSESERNSLRVGLNMFLSVCIFYRTGDKLALMQLLNEFIFGMLWSSHSTMNDALDVVKHLLSLLPSLSEIFPTSAMD
jgi:uncharacterized membrane protein YczE